MDYKKDIADLIAVVLFAAAIVFASVAIGVTFGAGWGFTWLCGCSVVGGIAVMVAVRRRR